MLRITISLLVVMGTWAGIFYYTIVDEVQDETDDVLEDYAAMIIQNFLAGEDIPTNDNGSNNTYSLRAIAAESVEAAKSRDGFESKDIFIEYKNEYEPARILRHLFRDRDDNYYEVTVTTPTIDKSDLIDAIWNTLIILFILLIIVVLIIISLALNGGLQPLRKFLKWLNSSSVENTTTPPTTINSNIREIKELSHAIEGYAERGKRAFEQQKEFIGNASHEIQTPIAICQNHLEMLIDSGLTEAQLTEVGECLNTLSRLSRLNKSLLMLSKIDNGGFETHSVNINNLVVENISALKEIYENRKVSLALDIKGECLVIANRELITTLIINLIKNSYTHSRVGADISIEIGTNYITISNSGESNPLDSEKIFSRFYQANAKSGSYGLGLSIVQSICKLYNYHISYNFDNNMHIFKIKFK